MNTFERVIDVFPHYLAMLALVFVALEFTREFLGIDNIVVFFGIVLAIVFLYRPVVLRLGVAPHSWEGEDRRS